MVEGVATELLCSVCDEVCKNGAQIKCCGARSCWACAVQTIKKTKKCWNEDCGQKGSIATLDLKKDELLMKAVKYFNKNGKMDPKHEKLLKKSRVGKTLEKKKIGKGIKMGGKKAYIDVAEKFNQPCGFGEKCKRKGCLFVHDKPTLGDKKKAAEKGVKENGKSCKFGAFCTKKETCKFSHPSINKPCKFGVKCSQKGCKFNHSPSSRALDRAIASLTGSRKQMGDSKDLRSRISQRRPMGGGMGPMGGGGMRPMPFDGSMGRRMGSMNLAQMQKMKQELEGMMANVVQSGQMKRGFGGSSTGGTKWNSGYGPSDRMGGYGPMRRGYGGSAGRYN